MGGRPTIDPYVEVGRLAEEGDPEAATEILLKFLDANFDDLNALAILGFALIKAEKWGLAYVCLKYCTLKDPAGAETQTAVWQNLAKCCHSVLRDDEAETYFRKAVQVDRNYVNGLDGLSLMHLLKADYGLSIEYGRRAIALEPDCIDAHVNMSMSLLALRKWKEAWPSFNRNIGEHKDRQELKYGSEPRWDGSPGKNLVCYGEQGLGDEICFASCLPDFIADSAKVTIECDRRLTGIFTRSFPSCEVIGSRYDKPRVWDASKTFDARVAIGQLPQFYRNSDESFPGKPYLVPEPSACAMWRTYLDRLGPRMKVGIAWNGGRKHTYQHKRSVTLEQLLPLLRLDCDWVSLEYLPRDKEIAEFKAKHVIEIHHWPHAVQAYDYDLTIAMLAELDLVISVTTAVVDACGAIGKECWCLVPRHPLWKHLESGTQYPWAESVTIFRQKGDVWPIVQIAARLEDRLLKKAA